MALSMRVRACDHGDIAAGIAAQFHAFVHAPADFDVAGHRAATPQSAFFGFGASRLEAVPVGLLQAAVHDHGEIAAVIDVACAARIGHGLRADEVAPANLDRRDARGHGAAIEQALHQRRRFRSSGTAVGGHRRRVGEDAA